MPVPHWIPHGPRCSTAVPRQSGRRLARSDGIICSKRRRRRRGTGRRRAFAASRAPSLWASSAGIGSSCRTRTQGDPPAGMNVPIMRRFEDARATSRHTGPPVFAARTARLKQKRASLLLSRRHLKLGGVDFAKIMWRMFPLPLAAFLPVPRHVLFPSLSSRQRFPQPSRFAFPWTTVSLGIRGGTLDRSRELSWTWSRSSCPR